MEERKSTIDYSDQADRIIHDEDAIALQEARNGLLQFDEVYRLAEEYSPSRQFSATPELILALNRIAIQGIRHSAGHFRYVDISITNTSHVPPAFADVPRLVSEMCDYVNENWFSRNDDVEDAMHIAAYLMWRVNWIHPFRDGNGRTSRAMSYLAVCTRLGRLLEGSPTIADQIVDNREPYYKALDAADAAWAEGTVDVSKMEELIRELLINQLSTIET